METFPFDLATNTVNPSCSLLDSSRIPTQIMMDHMATFTMQIDSFLTN